MTEETTPPAQPIIIERRKSGVHTPETCYRMDKAEERFNEGTERMKRIEESIACLTEHQTTSDAARKRMEEKLDENNEATYQLLDILKSGRGFFKVVDWAATVVKWTAGLVVAVGSVWLMFKDSGAHK